MYHYNYKITNVKTYEYYVGVRSCKCEIKDDPYMGSSSVWTKIYVKEHKKDLHKEILETFETRKLANAGKVRLLKKCEGDPLCVNKYFDYTPDVTGTKQTPEWIAKRVRFGKANGMFGKHHTEATKKRISEKLKGRVVSEEARKKIGDFNRGKFVSKETRKKLSKAAQKVRHFKNIKTGEEFDLSITEMIEKYPNEGYIANSMRKAAQEGCIYRKTWKITNIADLERGQKPDKFGETPNKENSDESQSQTTKGLDKDV